MDNLVNKRRVFKLSYVYLATTLIYVAIVLLIAKGEHSECETFIVRFHASLSDGGYISVQPSKKIKNNIFFTVRHRDLVSAMNYSPLRANSWPPMRIIVEHIYIAAVIAFALLGLAIITGISERGRKDRTG